MSYHIDFFFLTREDGLRENVQELKGKKFPRQRMAMQDVIVKYTISHTSIELFIKVLQKFNNFSTKKTTINTTLLYFQRVLYYPHHHNRQTVKEKVLNP